MAKFDWKKDLKVLYHASAGKPVLVDVPEMGYLMVDGQGNPNTEPAFRDAVEALYGLSYTVKFTVKQENADLDFKVFPLEALWWMASGGPFDMNTKDQWRWTMLMALPSHIGQSHVTEAHEKLEARRHSPALDLVRFEKWHEGPAVQVLHVGPYDAEGPTIELLHQFARDAGKTIHGKHHEIYLSDPRRCAPEKLKTILRHPVRS